MTDTERRELEAERLFIEPIRKQGLLALLASLEPLDETFPDVDEDLAPPDDQGAGASSRFNSSQA